MVYFRNLRAEVMEGLVAVYKVLTIPTSPPPARPRASLTLPLEGSSKLRPASKLTREMYALGLTLTPQLVLSFSTSRVCPLANGS